MKVKTVDSSPLSNYDKYLSISSIITSKQYFSAVCQLFYHLKAQIIPYLKFT